jgi:hypothetical protein
MAAQYAMAREATQCHLPRQAAWRQVLAAARIVSTWPGRFGSLSFWEKLLSRKKRKTCNHPAPKGKYNVEAFPPPMSLLQFANGKSSAGPNVP